MQRLEAEFATVDFETNLLAFRVSQEIIESHRWRAGKVQIDATEIMLPMAEEDGISETAESVLAEFVADIEASYPPGTSAEPDLADDWVDLAATYRKAKAVLGPTK
ncbi:MAG TPA: hypothetical protein VMW24_15935 [Sedimentisphaerales bacterium]|nr:hypothetical protein [Sedimentisphaerales bacterium]